MALEDAASLGDKTLERLQELIRINIDSHDGFMEAADKIDNRPIATVFRELAIQRSGFAEELKKFVRLNRERPEEAGGVAGAMHRLWIDLRSAISGGDPAAILSEAERGEDMIKSKYERALKETAGSPVNDVLLHQYAQVKEGHDRVRGLRDAHRA